MAYGFDYEEGTAQDLRAVSFLCSSKCGCCEACDALVDLRALRSVEGSETASNRGHLVTPGESVASPLSSY